MNDEGGFFRFKRKIAWNSLFGDDSTVVITQTHHDSSKFASDLCFCVESISSALLQLPGHSQNHNRVVLAAPENRN